MSNGDIEIPDDVPMEDLEHWERHIWMTPDLSVHDREVAIMTVRWVRGDVVGDTPELRRLYEMIGDALKNQEGP